CVAPAEEGIIHVPIGSLRHRVLAVQPLESFAFSTKERVPCFVCLEVVEEPQSPLPLPPPRPQAVLTEVEERWQEGNEEPTGSAEAAAEAAGGPGPGEGAG
ncbi:unnamed protein product, partial [Discosporangium mesarthrocarpum]